VNAQIKQEPTVTIEMTLSEAKSMSSGMLSLCQDIVAMPGSTEPTARFDISQARVLRVKLMNAMTEAQAS
jgi:hypothetical protein